MEATNLTARWYTTGFITASLKKYLEDNGYSIADDGEERSPNCDEIIVATKIFGREVIEIKGTILSTDALVETEASKRMKLLTDAMHWLSDVLLSPISFFVRHYADEKSPSLCLPDLDQYRDILQKVSEYFTANNLNLKVYLVRENGDVRVIYLNDAFKAPEAEDESGAS